MSSTKEEKIYKIRARSIFSLVPEARLSALVDASHVLTFKENIKVNEMASLEYLYVLSEGNLEQIDPLTGLPLDPIVAGRSIELETLIRGQNRWKTEWLSRTPCEVIAIPFKLLSDALKLSIAYTYLVRIVTHVELHKLKNDLKLLGMKQDLVHRLISDLVPLRKQEDFEEGALLVVKDGGVRVTQVRGSGEFELKHFSISDYFMISLDEKLTYQFQEPFEAWLLPEEKLKSLVGTTGFESCLDVLAQKKSEWEDRGKVKDVSEEVAREAPPQKPVELNEQDFYKDLPLPMGVKTSKPEIILLQDSVDRAAACMTMIAHFYQRKVNLPLWRSLMQVTREGASLLSIHSAASVVGFDSLEIQSEVAELPKFRTPFLARLTDGDVVVYGFNETHVRLGDPVRGLLEIPINEFNQKFTQKCLLLKPSEQFLKFPESEVPHKKYLSLFKVGAKEILPLIPLSFLIFIFSLVPALFTEYGVDQVILSGETKYLNRVGVLAILALFFLALIRSARSLMVSRVAQTLGIKFSSLFFRQVLRLPYSAFSYRSRGDFSARISELEKVQSFLANELPEGIFSALTLFFYAGLFSVYNFWFVGLTFVFTVSAILFSLPFLKKKMEVARSVFSLTAFQRSVAYEQARGLKTLHALAAESQARWKWQEGEDRLNQVKLQADAIDSKVSALGSILKQVVGVSFLFLGVELAMKGEMTLGQLIAVGLFSFQIVDPLEKLMRAVEEWARVRVSFEKIEEIITAAVETRVLNRAHYPGADRIEFKEVWFQFGSDSSPWALKGIQFSVTRGEHIGIVGQSGSGKSTLGFLLNLIYRPTRGEVMIGGVANTQFDLNELRNRVSMVLQESEIFSGSVLQNIALGDEFPDLNRAVAAAKVAEAHDFISNLPQGYSSLLQDGQFELSAGQKQRLGIARAIYRAPEIMVLDEATSVLDAATERKVIQNLKKELKGTTCFIIAHRLNTITDLDRILFLEQGKIVEQGSHAELMKVQGAYFQLFRKQVNG